MRALQENALTRTPPMRPSLPSRPLPMRDNVIGLAAFLLALASTVLILPALGVNSAGTLLVADVLTLIALGAGFLDYRRKAAFYHELHHLTGQLRQACVLPSLIAEPPFLDGEDRLRYGLVASHSFQPRRRQPCATMRPPTAVTWNCGSTR